MSVCSDSSSAEYVERRYQSEEQHNITVAVAVAAVVVVSRTLPLPHSSLASRRMMHHHSCRVVYTYPNHSTTYSHTHTRAPSAPFLPAASRHVHGVLFKVPRTFFTYERKCALLQR